MCPTRRKDGATRQQMAQASCQDIEKLNVSQNDIQNGSYRSYSHPLCHYIYVYTYEYDDVNHVETVVALRLEPVGLAQLAAQLGHGHLFQLAGRGGQLRSHLDIDKHFRCPLISSMARHGPLQINNVYLQCK